MEAAQWLAAATKQLDNAGIPSARLDCLILLEDETSKDRAWLLAHPEHALTAAQIASLNKKVMRRIEHVPLAYIRGKTEFYGRSFFVDERVLEPRPESETMISLLKDLAAGLPAKPVIVDVGTGSGALAITAILELPAASVYATDIDPGCLEVGRRNAGLLEADVSFVQTDLIADLAVAPDVLLANLPYVPDDFEINLAAGHEPRLAIFGGPDGLDLYRALFGQLIKKKLRPLFVLAESLPPQHETLLTIAASNGYDLTTTDGFIQVFCPAGTI